MVYGYVRQTSLWRLGSQNGGAALHSGVLNIPRHLVKPVNAGLSKIHY